MSTDAFNKLRLGLSSGVVGSALLLSGGAVSRVQAAESKPRGGSFVTVTRTGFFWYVSNNTGTGSGASSIVGFGLTDATGSQGSTITTGGSTVSLSDAFDGCESMGINGTAYADPDGTIDIVGDTAIGDPTSLGGLTVSREFRWMGPMTNGTAIMRSLNNFTNPGTSPVSVTVNFGCNLGSDSGTVIEGSSAGPGNNLVPDDAFWFVSSDGQPYSDPPITHVRYGTGSAVVPYFSSPFNNPNRGVANPGPGVNSWLDNYDITIPAGATVHIVRFIGLSNGAGVNLADIGAFTDLGTLGANGLLAGIDPAAQQNIRNFAAGSPPGPTGPSFAVPTMGKVGMGLMAGFLALLGMLGIRRMS